ncbi:MAG TPA: SDR family oxidoreductase [Silvibacterium sp.]|nr:SDR family oxidoreductase [Silvibacterium sp.]
MKIVIFGATGGTGRALVKQALAAGHEVTAFVRDPSKFAPEPRLRVAVGDALDGDTVRNAVAGQEAVISALGSRSLNDGTLLPRSMTHILAGMKQHGVRRLIVMGASGTMPQAEERLTALNRTLFRFGKAMLLRKPFASQTAMQKMVRASDTEWTIVQPPRLMNTPAKGRYRVDGEALPANGTHIPRADVATFMLAQLEKAEWVRRDVYVAS